MSIVRQRKIRYKKIRTISYIIVSMIVVICGIFVVHKIIYKDTKKVQVTQLEEKEISNHIRVAEDNNQRIEKQKISDDLRIHYFNHILISDKLSIGDYADIRIRFKNGMDFVVISKKMVVDLIDSSSEGSGNKSIWLEVSEEEILRMSSALVDSEMDGSKIYAIQYINELQRAAICNYPATEEVKTLIENNPNISNLGKNISEFYSRSQVKLLQKESERIEENKEDNQDWNKSKKENQDKKSVDGTEEIIYLD